LPYFDPFYSAASWYRDYVAYCGLADDGEKLYAVVAELGRKKPLVRRDLGAPGADDMRIRSVRREPGTAAFACDF